MFSRPVAISQILNITLWLFLTNMCSCGMSRAYPEFYLTEEDIKKFVSKLKAASKRLFEYASNDLANREKKLGQTISDIHYQ